MTLHASAYEYATLRPFQGIEKTVEHESNGDTNHNWYSWCSLQRIDKGSGGHRNKRTSGKHLNYSIIKIAQNAEESPGDEETCCHSNSGEKPSANAGVKNSKKSI